jgi:hypothetical protein
LKTLTLVFHSSLLHAPVDGFANLVSNNGDIANLPSDSSHQPAGLYAQNLPLGQSLGKFGNETVDAAQKEGRIDFSKPIDWDYVDLLLGLPERPTVSAEDRYISVQQQQLELSSDFSEQFYQATGNNKRGLDDEEIADENQRQKRQRTQQPIAANGYHAAVQGPTFFNSPDTTVPAHFQSPLGYIPELQATQNPQLQFQWAMGYYPTPEQSERDLQALQGDKWSEEETPEHSPGFHKAHGEYHDDQLYGSLTFPLGYMTRRCDFNRGRSLWGG